MAATANAHWPEYAIELGTLGAFMVSAAAMTALLEHPGSPARMLLPDAMARRVLMGAAMGLTAAGLIYSPLGRRSGAHMNPAVTLTFFTLGKISGLDAAGYMGAQFLGGLLGIALASLALTPWIGHPSVNYVATQPGPFGAAAAFLGEATISFVMMLAVLTVSNHARFARYTGAVAAVLVATFITIEAPLSGMSMNPARTLGPDIVGQTWHGLWIYFIAPPLGMLAAAEAFVRARGHHAVLCAKLHHDHRHCVFGCDGHR
jgi:aquaporin Z